MERMDAEEVEYEHRYEQKRVETFCIDGLAICCAKFIHGGRRFNCAGRTEADGGVAGRIGFLNDVVVQFPMSAYALRQFGIEIAVEL